MKLINVKIGIIGLGYVGLPLAIEFGKKYKTIGYDINKTRIGELKSGNDKTNECSPAEIKASEYLVISEKIENLNSCNIFIVTVPTPINNHKQPDLDPLIQASAAIGKLLKKNDLVIYESTVYPGATEEVCVPELEATSGFKLNHDFFVGYSPERINPGDKVRKLKNILKVTSGSTLEVGQFVNQLYSQIIDAGTHLASSIKVAEASKIIENVQRDVNIALINELHQIFTKLKIDTNEVIEASATKWNFMKLFPGFVGGHCISVDPYYLLHKSQESGYVPDLMRTAREINDSMPAFVVDNFLEHLIVRKISPIDLKVVIFGFAFKENCPDFRNTKVYDLYLKMVRLGFRVQIYDPVIDVSAAKEKYGIQILNDMEAIDASVAFIAVGHDEFSGALQNKSFDYIYEFKKLDMQSVFIEGVK